MQMTVPVPMAQASVRAKGDLLWLTLIDDAGPGTPAVLGEVKTPRLRECGISPTRTRNPQYPARWCPTWRGVEDLSSSKSSTATSRSRSACSW